MTKDIKKSDINKELLHLIGDFEANIVSIKNISSIFSSNIDKGSYKLILEDGQTLKWRKFEALYDAERVYSLWKHLNPNNFPRLIRRYETSMLLEWVEGTNLSSENILPLTYKRCGELLGKMHLAKITTDEIENFTKYTPKNTKEAIELILGYTTNIYSQGTVNDKEIDIIKKLVNKYSPQSFEMGLVLADLCPENIVTKKSGDICIIDNETLSIDSLDYDLARTFYRWPMNGDQKKAFLSGYETYRSAQSYSNHYYFWDIRVLVKSILHRTRAKANNAAVPIDKLKSLLRNF